MATPIEELRQRVLRAGGEYTSRSVAAGTKAGVLRPISMVRLEMKNIWFTTNNVRSWIGEDDTIIWPVVEGAHRSPPVKRFGGPCSTQIVLQEKMVNRRLWDEAQSALRLLGSSIPSSAASAREKAAWVQAIYEWVGVATLASCLHTDFWFVPEDALVPRCSGSECADFQRATLDCCPTRTVQSAWMVAQPTGAALDQVSFFRASTLGYSSAPDPRLWLFDIQNQVRQQYGCNMPERGCQVSGFLTPYPPETLTSGRFWLDYEVGPNWVLPAGTPGGGADVMAVWAGQPGANWPHPGAIPDAVLAQIDSRATQDLSRAERAHATFTSLPMIEQLTTIFEVLAGSTNVVAPTLRGWTVATPVGLIEQAKRTAAFWAGMNLDIAIGRAMFFYTANHLQYFAARGELGISAAEMEAAYRTIKNQSAAQIGAMLGGGAALVSLAGGPAGMVAGIVLGLVDLWSSATGWSMSDPFGVAAAIKAWHIPQPIFMRIMPECEELARLYAQEEGLPLGDVPPLNQPPPGLPLVLILGGSALVGGLVGWFVTR